MLDIILLCQERSKFDHDLPSNIIVLQIDSKTGCYQPFTAAL